VGYQGGAHLVGSDFCATCGPRRPERAGHQGQTRGGCPRQYGGPGKPAPQGVEEPRAVSGGRGGLQKKV